MKELLSIMVSVLGIASVFGAIDVMFSDIKTQDDFIMLGFYIIAMLISAFVVVKLED